MLYNVQLTAAIFIYDTWGSCGVIWPFLQRHQHIVYLCIYVHMYGIYCINYNGERVHGLNIWPQAQRTSTVYTTYVENVCDSIPPPPLTLWLEGVVIVIASSSLLSLLYVSFLCVLSACGVSSRTIYLPNSKPNVMSCGLLCVVYVLSWQNYFRENSFVFVRSSFGMISHLKHILYSTMFATNL